MQLISLPVSPFAARVRIAIYAKKLDIGLVPPPAGWPTVWDTRLGLIGRVPVLIGDDGIIPESQVILEYLEERYPDCTLLPASPKGRADARLLARIVDLYLMPPIVAVTEGDLAYLQNIADVLSVLNASIGENRFAAGDELSLADCALAPALFAARITGSRQGVDVLAGNENLQRYCASAQQHEAMGRVLKEMEDGLKQIETR